MRRKKQIKGKLVLISNREPYTHSFSKRKLVCKQTGGSLVSVLDPLMRESGNVWVAWGSSPMDFKATNSAKKVRVPDDKPSYWLRRVKLSKKEVNEYYVGFSNRVLWPLVHMMLDKVQFNENFWETYKKVNERFANIAVEEIKKNDFVWVQDYHLTLLPALIRKKRRRARIAFFFHLPWPPWEVFRTLPWKREILAGILGADLIGFHIDLYARNFLDCVRHEFDLIPKKGFLEYKGRKILCKGFPLGIDPEWFERVAEFKNTIKLEKTIRKKLNVEWLLLGVDRLDYSKGIPNKFRTFKAFIEKYPSYKTKVALVQLLTPPRAKTKKYVELEKEIDLLAGEINGQYQILNWAPIKCLDRFVPREQLVAYYRAADVAFVTPLIDGMNLVSKEFIASNTSHSKALILSLFAGAAEGLDQSIKVNPYDENNMVEAIHKALIMKPEEKRKSFNSLKRAVKKRNAAHWLNSFLKEWKKMYS